MDPRQNPYTPNAGAFPPVLVGRDSELEAFDVLLHRLRRGHAEQSMLITGLRGVGKTVLLNAFEERAAAAGWITVDAEITKDADFGRRMALLVRRALLRAAPRDRWKRAAQRAARVLKSFTLTVSPEGALTLGAADAAPEPGSADSGSMGEDLTDLLEALGEAAREHDKGVVFLMDEVQYLTKGELEALIAALHKTVQRRLPITLVGAGLPQLPRLAGEAKSYSERLFTFPRIGRLSEEDARTALVQPAEELGARYAAPAVEHVLAFAEGYPYFLQEYGKTAWDVAPRSPISLEAVQHAQALVEERLDESFFRVRAERTSDLELQYLRAMAELGPAPQRAGDVAAQMKRRSEQLGPARSRLIGKGLLYTPGHGLAAFTVPQFDRYMKRNYEFRPRPSAPADGA